MNTEACRIFYTDDDKDDREFFIDAALAISGNLEIVTQKSGDELLQLLNNQQPLPTLIFLDLNMPIKNGYEVLQEIKQSDRTKNLPVIVFSTSDDQKAIITTRELGANLYIPKPSSFANLKKVIKYCLSINWNAIDPSTDTFVYKVN